MNTPEPNIAHPTALDCDQQQIGVLYGKAILGAAGHNADEILSQLKSIVEECLNAHPSLESVLASPRVSQADKESMLERIFRNRIDPMLLNFLKVLCRRDRIASIRTIESTAKQLHDEAMGRVYVTVTSAQPLSDEQRSSIQQQLSNSLGKDVVLHEAVDPSLLGGIVIRVGDKVYDGSVQGKIESMRESVTKGIHKAIRENFAAMLSS